MTSQFNGQKKLTTMECVATQDIDNPHWDNLLEHVKQLNDQLLALAHFHPGKKKLLTDNNVLPTATSSIADACLEVTDATCVVMASMRLIIHNCVAVPQGQNRETIIMIMINAILFLTSGCQ